MIDDTEPKEGTEVFVDKYICPVQMYEWVETIKHRSGESVDWYYRNYHIVIVTTGDVAKVTEVITQMLPDYKRMREDFLFYLTGI